MPCRASVSSYGGKNAGPPLSIIQRTPVDDILASPGQTRRNDGARADVDMSSQTEPESSQWRIPTQHSQRCMTKPESPSSPTQMQSSQTEPESSQWRIKTQSSMTDPESSQWHVPTQYSPSRVRNKQHRVALINDDEDEHDPSRHLQLSHSIPIASYDEEADVSTSRSQEPTSLGLASPSLSDLDSQEQHLLRMMEDPSLASKRFLRKVAHVRATHARKRLDRLESDAGDGDRQGDRQDHHTSSFLLSVPSDYCDSPSSRSAS